MTRFTIFMYRYFQQHRLLMWVLMLISFALFAFVGSKMEYEEDISKLLPGVDEERAEGLVFSSLQIKDRIFVLVTANDSVADVDNVVAAADMFVDSLLEYDAEGDVRNILYKIDDDMLANVVDYAVGNVPLFVDTTYYGVIDSICSSENIEKQMKANLELLSGADGSAYYDLVQYDPLGFRNLLMGKNNGTSTAGMGGDFSIYDRHLITQDSSTAIIFLAPNFIGFDSKTGIRLAKKIEKSISAVNQEFTDVEVLFHGTPVQSVYNSRRIKTDLAVTMGLSMALICIILLLCMRNKSTLTMLVMPVVYGAAFSLCVLYLMQGRMSLMALGIGAIVLGVALSYCLHVITHYKYVSDPETVLRDQTRPVILGNVTTIGAFMGLLFTGSPLLCDFGLFASLAMVGTTGFCLLFLPQFFAPERNRRSERAFAWLEKFNNYQFEKHHWIPIAIGVLLLVCFYTSGSVTFDSNLRNIGYFDKEVSRSMNLYSAKTTNGLSTNYYAIVSKNLDSALMYNKELYRVCDSLKNEGRIASFSKSSSILLPEAEQLTRFDKWQSYWTDERIAKLKNDVCKYGQQNGFKPEMFSQFFDMLEQSYAPNSLYDADVLPEGFLSSMVEKSEDSYMVFTSVRAEQSNVASNNDVFAAVPHAVVVDPFYYTGNMVEMMNEDFNIVLGISSVFVFIVLLFSFRSVVLAALAFIPMGASWYITLGIMGVLDIQFNLINIVISTFIFGIGVDYSIFVMDGLLARVKSSDAESGKLLMYHKTAIFFSGMVMIIGVASLIFAVHPAIHSIGFATLIGMTSTIVITYTVQPSLFVLLLKTRFGQKIIAAK
ncbi:MAG: MMPL family transporter [Salinivirgaceae bacterium]|nr:MMPL family transporter [Salinivirgaceae bacterium]